MYDRRWTVIGSGDFNGDGRDDGLFRHQMTGAVAFLRMESTGQTWVPLTPTLGLEWHVEAIGDYDNDGTDDVYWARPNSPAFPTPLEGWWNIDGGAVIELRFVSPPIANVFFSGISASGDYLGDGSEDLIQTSGVLIPGGIPPTVYTRHDLVGGVVTGSGVRLGSYSDWRVVLDLLEEQLGPAPAPRRAVYDFTGDGTSDLLWRRTDGLLWFWDSDRLGASPSGNRVILGSVGSDWDLAAVGDYTGDRTSDLLFRNPTSGALGYWSVGRGALQQFVPLRWDLGLAWQVVSSRTRADFNGDGRDDILFRHVSGALGMYLVTGPGAFQVQWVDLGALDPAWVVQGTGDFTGDAREDVLVRHTATGAVRYARMSGAGIEGWTDLVTSLDPGWYVGAIADFNADGFADIFWRTSTSLPEGYWDMANGAINGFRINRRYQPFPGRPTIGFTAGDYHGDRSEDVVAFSPGSDQNGWFLLGFVDGVDTRLDLDIISLGWALQ